MPAEPVAPAGSTAWSLRRRLLLLTALATLAAWVAGGSTTYFVSNRQSEVLSDHQMSAVARAVLTLSDHEIDEIRLAGGGVIHLDEDPALERQYRYQVWLPQPPKLLLTNGDAKAWPIAPFDQDGYVTRDIDGEAARTAVVWSEDRNKLIAIAQPLRLRESFPKTAHLTLFVLFLVSLSVLLAIDAWMIRQATRSLQDSAAQLKQRSPDDLRPIEVHSPPDEVLPLVSAINALFRRFQQTLENERRFTAAAAHELRTPLAAVKVHAQVAQLTRTVAERKDALARLLVAIDRAARMIDQLLTLSRLEGQQALGAKAAALRLDLVAAHVIDELRPLLERRGQRIDARLSPCAIIGMEFGVASLLRNLIDNALRFAPPDSSIRVSVGPGDGRCVACVEDAGPGIPDAERERVFERFHRLSNDSDGCGIGLSIVRAVAEAHQARIDLGRSDLGGLRITITFPASPELPPAAVSS
jgi:signal transduction histidine kinase